MPKASNDVIHIRVDAAAAVRQFLGLLAEQAAAGETRAPAKPANRAVFRELAPYRLVEYSYVDEDIGAIEGVFLSFPHGGIYSVSEDIPEDVVDALVAGDPAAIPPIYVHVVLAEARPAERVDHFLTELARHMDSALVGVVNGRGRRYECGNGCDAMLAAVEKCNAEAAGLPDKAQVLAGFAARSECPDGRAYAQLTYDFAKHLLEFASAADRDDFVTWSRILRDSGVADVPHPAVPAAAPSGELVAVPLVAPAKHGAGDVRAYWAYVVATVAAGEG